MIMRNSWTCLLIKKPHVVMGNRTPNDRDLKDLPYTFALRFVFPRDLSFWLTELLGGNKNQYGKPNWDVLLTLVEKTWPCKNMKQHMVKSNGTTDGREFNKPSINKVCIHKSSVSHPKSSFELKLVGNSVSGLWNFKCISSPRRNMPTLLDFLLS